MIRSRKSWYAYILCVSLLTAAGVDALAAKQDIAAERVTIDPPRATDGTVADKSTKLSIRNEPQNTLAGATRDYTDIAIGENGKFTEPIYRLPIWNKLSLSSELGSEPVVDYKKFETRADELKVEAQITVIWGPPDEGHEDEAGATADVMITVGKDAAVLTLGLSCSYPDDAAEPVQPGQIKENDGITSKDTYVGMACSTVAGIKELDISEKKGGLYPVYAPFSESDYYMDVILIRVDWLKVWLDDTLVGANSGHILYVKGDPETRCHWPCGTLVIHKSLMNVEDTTSGKATIQAGIGGYTVIDKTKKGIVELPPSQIGLRDMINEQGRFYSGWVIPPFGVTPPLENESPAPDIYRLHVHNIDTDEDEWSTTLRGNGEYQGRGPSFVGVGDSFQFKADGTIHNLNCLHPVRLIGIFSPKDDQSPIADLCDMGVFSGKEPGLVNVRLNGVGGYKSGSGPSDPDDGPIDAYILKADLETVAFTGTGLDGIPMKDHYKDMNGNNQRDTGEDAVDNDISVAPEWVGDDIDVAEPTWLTDGQDADSDPERNKHALVPRNTQFKAKAVFTIQGDPALAQGDVKAWATCTDNNLTLASEQNPLTLDKVGGKWQKTFQVATAPTKTGIFDFEWTWHVKIRGQEIGYSKKSSHKVFVCYDTPPAGYKPHDWVAWWSCEWGKDRPGMGETDAEARKNILDDIYDNLPSTGTTGAGIALGYEYPMTGGDSVENLLVNKKGKCGSWSLFFIDSGKVHNITDVEYLGWYIQGADIAASGIEKEECAAAFMLAAAARDVDGSKGIGGINPVPDRFAFQDHGFCAYKQAQQGGGWKYFIYDPTFRNSRISYDNISQKLPGRYAQISDWYAKVEITYFIHVTTDVAFDNQPGNNWLMSAEQHKDKVDWIPVGQMTEYPRGDQNYKITLFDPDHFPGGEVTVLHKDDF